MFEFVVFLQKIDKDEVGKLSPLSGLEELWYRKTGIPLPFATTSGATATKPLVTRSFHGHREPPSWRQ